MVLYDILVNDFLSLFIDIEILNSPIGIANWLITYLDIFKLFYVVAITYFLVWFFVHLPINILKKIMRYKRIKDSK